MLELGAAEVQHLGNGVVLDLGRGWHGCCKPGDGGCSRARAEEVLQLCDRA